MKLVSACLAGINCRWDGKSKPNKKILLLVKQGKAILVCPEQLGGLTTPRMPAECKGKFVIDVDGNNVTKQFVNGAKEGLKIAKLYNCKEAILKSKSPSCGCGKTYNGNFDGTLIDKDGVFCKLLKQNNIKVITEKEL